MYTLAAKQPTRTITTSWARPAARLLKTTFNMGIAGAAVPYVAFVPTFNIALNLAHMGSISLGHIPGLGNISGILCWTFAVAAIPLLMYVAINKELKYLLAAGAASALLLGTLFGLSFN